MTITRRHLPRREVLRGLGVALGLPLLDSMVPALTALRATAADPVRRLGIVYVPMGMFMAKWTPPGEGALELSPILEPIGAFKDRVLVLSGLDMIGLPGGGVHSRLQPAWLTATLARKTEGPDLEAGTSLDQIVAKARGNETELASLEVALEIADGVGNCDSGYACTYTSTLCWRSPKMPLPMEGNPRAVFERLFGASDSTESRVRLQYLQKNSSLLDSVVDEVGSLRTRLGPHDRSRLSEYLESIRDVERRIQKAEEQVARELPVLDRPVGVPAMYGEYARLMFDLITIAYQCDVTRVATMMMGRELSLRTFPEIGVPDPHHPLSHHANNPEKLEKQARINIFHMQLFTAFLEKLRSIPDGDGSLLDHTLFFYGSSMSNSDQHLPFDVPTMVVGGQTFGIKGGRHLRYAKGTPLANLHLTLLDRMGVPVERFGDSTGQLNLLTGL